MTDVSRALSGFVSATLTESVSDALGKANSRTAGQVKAMLQMMDRGIGPEHRLPIMQDAAKKAQRSMLASYDRTRRGGGPVGYRQQANNPRNRRYAGGRLRQALASPGFYRVTADGVDFGDTRILNDKAKQWARLDQGAAPRGQGTHATFKVHWSNLVVATVAVDLPARAPFSVPDGIGRRGYWLNGEFHPAGEGPLSDGTGDPGSAVKVRKRPSRGIQARNFMLAGTRRLVEGDAGTGAGSIPDRLRTMYVAAYKDATTRALAEASGIVMTRPTNTPKFKIVRT